MASSKLSLYEVIVTETFEKEFKKFKKQKEMLNWLIKIKEELSKHPEKRKPLRGRLHGI